MATKRLTNDLVPKGPGPESVKSAKNEVYMFRLILILTFAFLLSGCRGSGSTFSSLFDSGSSSSGISGSSSSSFDSGGSTSGSGVQTYHNPEPAALALFGIGLAGLAAAKLKEKKR